MKILILSCSTGEGHNSAARAISECLSDCNIENEVMDPIGLKGEKIKDAVSNAYNNLIQKMPIGFGAIYSVGKLYDNLNLPSPVYYANSKYVDELYNYIKEKGYTKVVCTHLYCMLAMTELNKRYDNHIPTYGILTDYTIIPFFGDTKLDGYFVPTDEVKEELIAKGIDKNTIFVSGIPVSKRFNKNISKEKAKEELGIPNDKKVITLMSGGVGCGNILKLSKFILKELDDSYLLYIFTGKNKDLKNKIDLAFNNNDRVKSVGFTLDINKYLKSSEVALSKPGGLSSTEIAVTNTPFIHLKEIPGCETKNIRYFTGNGMSLLGRSNYQISKSIRLLDDENIKQSIINNQTKFIRKDSCDFIVKELIRS